VPGQASGDVAISPPLAELRKNLAQTHIATMVCGYKFRAALPHGVVINMRCRRAGAFVEPRRTPHCKKGGLMTFRLHQAQYDDQTERAYVELRRTDGDGRDQLVVVVFTFRTKERLSKQRITEEVVRKARHVLKGAVLAA